MKHWITLQWVFKRKIKTHYNFHKTIHLPFIELCKFNLIQISKPIVILIITSINLQSFKVLYLKFFKNMCECVYLKNNTAVKN